jgi:hypothetical protein
MAFLRTQATRGGIHFKLVISGNLLHFLPRLRINDRVITQGT